MFPLTGRLEADKDVARVRLGGKEPQFGPRAADVAAHVGRGDEQCLDAAEDSSV